MKRLRQILRLHGKIYVLPIGFLCIDICLSAYSLFLPNRIGFPVFNAVIITGWISFASGVLSLFSIRKNKFALGLALIHAFINSLALLVLTVLWLKEASDIRAGTFPGRPLIFFKILTLGLWIAGIYLGRTSVRKHLL